jgi:hypothetical protein
MRFKRKNLPMSGAIRTITKFCWLPECINSEIIWLEKITIEQRAVIMQYEVSTWFEWKTIKEIK